MHRSWLRTKFAQGRTKLAGKVSERAQALSPRQVKGVSDTCMTCGRRMRPRYATKSDGRVCSAACAQAWANEIK